MTPRRCLPEDIVNRILAGGLCALNKGFTKADFLDFARFNAVLADVLNSVFRPDELTNRHAPILGEGGNARNESAERLWRSPASRANVTCKSV